MPVPVHLRGQRRALANGRVARVEAQFIRPVELNFPVFKNLFNIRRAARHQDIRFVLRPLVRLLNVLHALLHTQLRVFKHRLHEAVQVRPVLIAWGQKAFVNFIIHSFPGVFKLRRIRLHLFIRPGWRVRLPLFILRQPSVLVP